jgi:hypothetical protein
MTSPATGARWPDPLRPLPTETFSKEATLDVGGVKLELKYKGENHCPGNIFIYAPRQKVLTKIDIVGPGLSVFFRCDASENKTGWIEAHDQILECDFVGPGQRTSTTHSPTRSPSARLTRRHRTANSGPGGSPEPAI